MAGFLTPQNNGDCCCNGVPHGPCRCTVSSNGCGIRVICLFPRDQWNFPSIEPHQIRIVKLDEVGEIESVVVGPTDDFDLIWNPPAGTSGTYRAEVCCTDPGYGECEWTPIGTVVINITSDSCPLSVGIVVCIWGINSCTASSPETLRIFGLARSNCGITSLKIDGDSVLPDSDDTLHWVTGSITCLSGTVGSNFCGPVDGWTHPSGFGNVASPLYTTESTPVEKDEWCVTATDSCGNFRECCVSVPCWLKTNYLRIEIPPVGEIPFEAHWTRAGAVDGSPFPTIEQVMNFEDCAAVLRSSHCGSEPVFLYVDDIHEDRKLTVNIDGGSFFFRRNGGNSGFDDCNTDHIYLGTGTVEFNREVSGRNLIQDTSVFPIKLKIDGPGSYSLGYTYAVDFYLNNPAAPTMGLTGMVGFYIFAVPATDGTGYFESDTYVRLSTGACSYSGAIVGSPLRAGGGSGELFPQIARFLVADGSTVPSCGTLLSSAWAGSAFTVDPAILYNYGIYIASSAVCGVTNLKLVSQSGSIAGGAYSPTVGYINFAGGSEFSTDSAPISYGSLYAEWVAV